MSTVSRKLNNQSARPARSGRRERIACRTDSDPMFYTHLAARTPSVERKHFSDSARSQSQLPNRPVPLGVTTGIIIRSRKKRKKEEARCVSSSRPLAAAPVPILPIDEDIHSVIATPPPSPTIRSTTPENSRREFSPMRRERPRRNLRDERALRSPRVTARTTQIFCTRRERTLLGRILGIDGGIVPNPA